MNILLAALSIFILRLLDQTLGTLRILYVNKGKPLFGAIFVTIPVAIVGYFQWGLDMNYLIFLATYLIIQALDGNVLFPLLIGREVNLHPVLIVLAILIFGGIWGFWGVLLAVPLATAIRAVIKSWPAVNN